MKYLKKKPYALCINGKSHYTAIWVIFKMMDWTLQIRSQPHTADLKEL